MISVYVFSLSYAHQRELLNEVRACTTAFCPRLPTGLQTSVHITCYGLNRSNNQSAFLTRLYFLILAFLGLFDGKKTAKIYKK
jgi:hypothetical protein